MLLNLIVHVKSVLIISFFLLNVFKKHFENSFENHKTINENLCQSFIIISTDGAFRRIWINYYLLVVILYQANKNILQPT